MSESADTRDGTVPRDDPAGPGPQGGPRGRTGADVRVVPLGVDGLLTAPGGVDREERWRRAQALASALRELGPTRAPWLVDVVATYAEVVLELAPDGPDPRDRPDSPDRLARGQSAARRVAPGSAAARHDPGVTRHDPEPPERVVRRLLAGLDGAEASLSPAPDPLEVPVVLGGEAGPDLDEVARELGVGSDTLVSRLLASPWTVRFVASPPGSPFCERDDWTVTIPRSATPRTVVPAGSLALSGAQAMVYGVRSPGGWRLVGRTPLAALLREDPSSTDASTTESGDPGPGDGLRPRWAPGDRLRLVAVREGLAVRSEEPAGPVDHTATGNGADAADVNAVGPGMIAAARPAVARVGDPAPAVRTHQASDHDGYEGDHGEDGDTGSATVVSAPAPGAGRAAVTESATPAPRPARAACEHPGPPVLRVLAAGLLTCQDLGRPGLGHLGISVHGAADQGSARLAAALVGNAPSTPHLELTASGARLEAEADLLVAVTGAVAVAGPSPTVDGVPVPTCQPIVARTGSVLDVPAPRRGLRTCVAVAGGVAQLVPPTPDGVAVPPLLGSAAPDPGLGWTGLLGAGDLLAVGACACGWRHLHDADPPFRLAVPDLLRPRAPGPDGGVVEAVAGPEREEYADVAGPWTVSPASDHVGLRLDGPTPQRRRPHELLSRGVPVGAIEAPPGGGLLVLLRGRLVTAGYPVPLVATPLTQDLLGQARAGDVLRLREVTAADAHAARTAWIAALDGLAARATVAREASGLAAVLGRF